MTRHEIHKKIRTANRQMAYITILAAVVNTIFMFVFPASFSNFDCFTLLLIMSLVHTHFFLKCMDGIMSERKQLEEELKKLDHPDSDTPPNNK